MSLGGVPRGSQDPVNPPVVPEQSSSSSSSVPVQEREQRMSSATKPAIENQETKHASSLKERVIKGKDSIKEYIMDRTLLGMVIGGVNSAAKKIFGSSPKTEQEHPNQNVSNPRSKALPTGDDAKAEGGPVQADEGNSSKFEDPFLAHFDPSLSRSTVDGKPPEPPSREGEEVLSPPPPPPREEAKQSGRRFPSRPAPARSVNAPPKDDSSMSEEAKQSGRRFPSRPAPARPVNAPPLSTKIPSRPAPPPPSLEVREGATDFSKVAEEEEMPSSNDQAGIQHESPKGILRVKLDPSDAPKAPEDTPEQVEDRKLWEKSYEKDDDITPFSYDASKNGKINSRARAYDEIAEANERFNAIQGVEKEETSPRVKFKSDPTYDELHSEISKKSEEIKDKKKDLHFARRHSPKDIKTYTQELEKLNEEMKLLRVQRNKLLN